MEGEGADAKAIINFDNAGEKKIVTKIRQGQCCINKDLSYSKYGIQYG